MSECLSIEGNVMQPLKMMLPGLQCVGDADAVMLRLKEMEADPCWTQRFCPRSLSSRSTHVQTSVQGCSEQSSRNHHNWKQPTCLPTGGCSVEQPPLESCAAGTQGMSQIHSGERQLRAGQWLRAWAPGCHSLQLHALPLTSCGTSVKLPNLSVPLFPPLF